MTVIMAIVLLLAIPPVWAKEPIHYPITFKDNCNTVTCYGPGPAGCQETAMMCTQTQEEVEAKEDWYRLQLCLSGQAKYCAKEPPTTPTVRR